MNSTKIRYLALTGAGALLVAALVATGVIRFRARPTSAPRAAITAAEVSSIKARAEAGDVAAQNALGDLYAKGDAVAQSFAEAFKWYRAGAEKGLPEAECSLAMLLETGQGTTRDEAEAAKWYQKAAAQGHAGAAYNLAAMYATGRGVPHDAAEAARYYRLAAEGGDALAQYNLGRRCEVGKGVAVNRVEAYQWHTLAARQGIDDAASALAALKGQMTREEIAEGQRRADAFVARKPAAVPAK